MNTDQLREKGHELGETTLQAAIALPGVSISVATHLGAAVQSLG